MNIRQMTTIRGISFAPQQFLSIVGRRGVWQQPPSTSAISLSRRTADCVATASGTPRSIVSNNPCTTSDGLAAALAVPDAHGMPLDRVLATERADVPGVLGNFHLLHLLSEGGTVSVDLSPHTTRCRGDFEAFLSLGIRSSREFGIACLVPC